MWTKSKSIRLSQALAILSAVLVTVVAFIIPDIVDLYVIAVKLIKDSTVETGLRIGTTVNLYAMLIPAYIALIALFSLLKNIRKDEIFVSLNVKLLRILSYCCFAETVLFTVFAFVFATLLPSVEMVAIVVAFAAAFFGLILRVIKNVFEKAIEIREENEFTI